MNTSHFDRMLNRYVRRGIMPVHYQGMSKPFMYREYVVATDGKAMLLLKIHKIKKENPLPVPNISALVDHVLSIKSSDFVKFTLSHVPQAKFIINWCSMCDHEGGECCTHQGYDLEDAPENIHNFSVAGKHIKINVKYLNWLEGIKQPSWTTTSYINNAMLVIRHQHGYCLIMGCN